MAKKDQLVREAAEVAVPMPYVHAIPVSALGEGAHEAFSLAPDATERDAIASFLGVDGVDDLTFKGSVTDDGAGCTVEGQLRARLVQSCVVTLEPVVTSVDLTVERRFLRGLQPLENPGEVELREDDDSAPDPLGDSIDLGAIMIEALALEVDPYPRAEGAEHGTRVYAPPGAAPLDDQAIRPFASLADLRARLTGKDEGKDEE